LTERDVDVELRLFREDESIYATETFRKDKGYTSKVSVLVSLNSFNKGLGLNSILNNPNRETNSGHARWLQSHLIERRPE
jgi:hypothetical protein